MSRTAVVDVGTGNWLARYKEITGLDYDEKTGMVAPDNPTIALELQELSKHSDLTQKDRFDDTKKILVKSTDYVKKTPGGDITIHRSSCWRKRPSKITKHPRGESEEHRKFKDDVADIFTRVAPDVDVIKEHFVELDKTGYIDTAGNIFDNPTRRFDVAVRYKDRLIGIELQKSHETMTGVWERDKDYRIINTERRGTLEYLAEHIEVYWVLVKSESISHQFIFNKYNIISVRKDGAFYYLENNADEVREVTLEEFIIGVLSGEILRELYDNYKPYIPTPALYAKFDTVDIEKDMNLTLYGRVCRENLARVWGEISELFEIYDRFNKYISDVILRRREYAYKIEVRETEGARHLYGFGGADGKDNIRIVGL